MNQQTTNTIPPFPPKTYKHQPTIWENILIGSGAGTLEVLIDHPFWMIKTRMQTNKRFTINPRILYRGILTDAFSMVPITAIQVTLNQTFQTLFYKDYAEITLAQQSMTAFLAGASSAIVACPTERIMTFEDKLKQNAYQTVRYLTKDQGIKSIFAGLTATALRDAKFASGYLVLAPVFKKNIKPYFLSDNVASILSGSLAGVCTTLISQPDDTIKTIQQFAEPGFPVSMKDAIKKIYHTKGPLGFFSGTIPRGARVVSALTILSTATEKLKLSLGVK